MALPETGRDRETLRQQMEARQQGDADWAEGRTWSLVYSAGEEVHDVRDEAYREFASENALNPLAFPSVLSFENEVVGMVADMMNGQNAVGNVTSGGTESILCASYAARERAREVDDVTDPTMVMAETAHPAWEKAAHYLGLEAIRTPTRDDWRADPDAIAGAIDDRTALVVASAPSYPHGVVDPVEEVAGIAADRGVLCHVDACIGGFVLPFLPELGYDVPAYDFSVEGVTSMSVDPHKYGYTAKGVSTVLYRDRELRRHQYYAFDGWPGGIYVAPNFQGTRPAGPIAAAWAVMNFLGRDGYEHLVADAMGAAEEIADHVAGHDDLAVVSDPDMSLLAIESTSADVNAWTVQRELSDDGWELERQQRPESMHLSAMAQHAPVVEEFLADLEAAVDTARDADTEEADAPLYGLSGSLDEDDEVTEALVDMLNDVFV
ncbi:pyridoxal phosphate-dependent decarboxylase family protein [Natronomonas marina]|jgi:sphinganine-1-phosphate aldolase|uniref:pyridoxal phosphate-dependent decarboxylase family protein n=1 Tax=Natronomonas marina TaxID=2961939 RepID=UPI0020C9A672|nr:aspartate aminotransferase family protein [Natronomonas marina]